MLHDLDRTLRKLLIENGRLDKNEIEISFDQPNRDWASRLGRPTINCWCFELRENVKLRNVEMNMPSREEREKMLRAGNRQIQMRLPPLRFDVLYLVTAWARKVEDEHQLLWRALGALAKTKTLAPEDCEGSLTDQPYDLPIMVAQASDTMTSITDLWTILDNQMRLGFTTQVTLALDPERIAEALLVTERGFRVGQTEFPDDMESRKMTIFDGQLIYRMRKTRNKRGQNNS